MGKTSWSIDTETGGGSLHVSLFESWWHTINYGQVIALLHKAQRKQAIDKQRKWIFVNDSVVVHSGKIQGWFFTSKKNNQLLKKTRDKLGPFDVVSDFCKDVPLSMETEKIAFTYQRDKLKFLDKKDLGQFLNTFGFADFQTTALVQKLDFSGNSHPFIKASWANGNCLLESRQLKSSNIIACVEDSYKALKDLMLDADESKDPDIQEIILEAVLGARLKDLCSTIAKQVGKVSTFIIKKLELFFELAEFNQLRFLFCSSCEFYDQSKIQECDFSNLANTARPPLNSCRPARIVASPLIKRCQPSSPVGDIKSIDTEDDEESKMKRLQKMLKPRLKGPSKHILKRSHKAVRKNQKKATEFRNEIDRQIIGAYSTSNRAQTEIWWDLKKKNDQAESQSEETWSRLSCPKEIFSPAPLEEIMSPVIKEIDKDLLARLTQSRIPRPAIDTQLSPRKAIKFDPEIWNRLSKPKECRLQKTDLEPTEKKTIENAQFDKMNAELVTRIPITKKIDISETLYDSGIIVDQINTPTVENSLTEAELNDNEKLMVTDLLANAYDIEMNPAIIAVKEEEISESSEYLTSKSKDYRPTVAPNHQLEDLIGGSIENLEQSLEIAVNARKESDKMIQVEQTTELVFQVEKEDDVAEQFLDDAQHQLENLLPVSNVNLEESLLKLGANSRMVSENSIRVGQATELFEHVEEMKAGDDLKQCLEDTKHQLDTLVYQAAESSGNTEQSSDLSVNSRQSFVKPIEVDQATELLEASTVDLIRVDEQESTEACKSLIEPSSDEERFLREKKERRARRKQKKQLKQQEEEKLQRIKNARKLALDRNRQSYVD